MKQFKLTETEARSIAAEIAKFKNRLSSPASKIDVWFSDYMKTYNETMNIIEKYNQSVEE